MTGNGTPHMPTVASWTAHLANPVLRAAFAHRVLHPVRLHRHFHLHQLRAGAAAARGRHDGARHHLSRVPAVDRDDAARRRARVAPRHAASALGRRSRSRARACRCFSLPRLAPRARRDGARRGRHVLRAGACNGLRQPRAPRPTAAPRAASISPPTSSAASSAAPSLGQLFDRFGWEACVAGIGGALAVAALLTRRLVIPGAGRTP